MLREAGAQKLSQNGASQEIATARCLDPAAHSLRPPIPQLEVQSSHNPSKSPQTRLRCQLSFCLPLWNVSHLAAMILWRQISCCRLLFCCWSIMPYASLATLLQPEHKHHPAPSLTYYRDRCEAGTSTGTRMCKLVCALVRDVIFGALAAPRQFPYSP